LIRPSRTTPALIPIFAILSAYTAALVLWRDRVPDGLFNDPAQEALRGLYLVEGRHFEAITFSVGHSAETLYLYLLGAMIRLLGPDTIAIQLTTWLFALACILLVWRLTRAVADEIPPWIPALAAASSLWLYHYARSGLRAISAPFFLAAFALLLDRAERRPASRLPGIICGVVLGLSVYAYTSCRVLPLAFILYAAVRAIAHRDKRQILIRCYGTILVSALFTSIPNLLLLLRQPGEFLLRGSYVVLGNAEGKGLNFLWSALLPFHYPDGYRDVSGPGYLFDSVSAALTARGHNPVHFVFAAAMLLGLVEARRFIEKPVLAFLLSAWITSILALGVAGPSATRFLILLPVYLVLAALGLGSLVRKFPPLRSGVLVLMFWAGLSEGYTYLFGGGESQAASIYFSSSATPIGKRAANLAAQGRRVLCVLERDKNVVVFLSHDQSARVRIVEFYRRPLEPSELPFVEFQPDDLLIENVARFNVFTGRFPPEWRTGRDDHFHHVRFPPRYFGSYK
jgi:hypothetical protein